MPAGRYKVYVDWNADGDFSDPREDVTSDVLDARFPVTMQYGRDQDRALSPIAAGEGSFALDNQSRIYSPENTSSPLTDQVVPGRALMITGQLSTGGTVYTMLRANLDDLKLMPGREDRYLSIQAIDGLGQLQGVTISTGVYQGLRPGEAIGVILDAVGWSATLRDLDLGATVMPFWWVDNSDALTAVLDLVASEGPPSLVTVDSSGRFVFRSRHHRLLLAASTTAQSTWQSSGSLEPMFSAPTDYSAGFTEIINSISFELPLYFIAEPAPVWTSPGQLSIAAGETLNIVAQGTSPFINAIAPVADTDFTVLSGSVSVALLRTSGASTTIQIAAAGSAVISDLQLRAQAITTASTVQISAQDGASILKYGPQSLPSARAPKWASRGDAQAICNVILGARAERLPTISVTMKSANPTRLTQQLTRNLSDRVRIVESHSGLDADCFIERIGHTITEGGADHKTTFGCEKAPTQIAGAFILGSATSGVLGTNKLGRRGLANPSTMFTLGTGVLGTNILAA